MRILPSRLLAEQLGNAGRVNALTKFSEDIFIDRFVERCKTLSQQKGK